MKLKRSELDEKFRRYAMPYNIYKITDSDNTNRLFEHIYDEFVEDGMVTIKTKARQKEALKNLLLNIITCYRLYTPIYYPRKKEEYTKGFFSKPWYTRSILIPIIDWMTNKDYINHVDGYYNIEKGKGYSSMFFATEKFIKLNLEFNYLRSLIKEDKPLDLIILRPPKGSKQFPRPINVLASHSSRKKLNKYNSFIKEQSIVFKVPTQAEVSLETLKSIFQFAMTEQISIDRVKLNTQFTHPSNILPNRLPHSYHHTTYSPPSSSSTTTNNSYPIHPPDYTYPPQQPSYIEGHIERIASADGPLLCGDLDPKLLLLDRLFCLYLSSRENPDILLESSSLFSLGIDYLEFTSNSNTSYRVFNDGVKDGHGRYNFNSGGRYYGGLVLRPESSLRQYIYINDEPASEPDFSGMHVRMLYHEEGLDFTDECYVIPKSVALADTESKTIRNKFKLVQLISINCLKHNARRAIEDEFLKNGIYEEYYGEIDYLIEEFITYHKPISNRIFSSKLTGKKLQCKDSRIMEGILDRLTTLGIPAIPVHDSVVVPASQRALTVDIMREEYKKVMKFDPVVE